MRQSGKKSSFGICRRLGFYSLLFEVNGLLVEFGNEMADFVLTSVIDINDPASFGIINFVAIRTIGSTMYRLSK